MAPEVGKEESADFLIGALEAGTISGEVVISYEDANMNVNELIGWEIASALGFTERFTVRSTEERFAIRSI